MKTNVSTYNWTLMSEDFFGDARADNENGSHRCRILNWGKKELAVTVTVTVTAVVVNCVNRHRCLFITDKLSS